MRRVVLTGTVVGIVAMTIAGAWWIATTPREALPVGWRPEEVAVYALIQLAFGSVGLLLAARRPRNPIGWLFLVTALVSAWLQASSAYALSAIVDGRPEGPPVAWIYNLSPIAFIALVVSAIVVFPDGHPSSRRGHAVLWLLPVALVPITVFVGSRPGPMFNMPSVSNPYALAADDRAGLALLLVGVPSMIAVALLLVRDLIVRFREASGVRRQQLKWLLWSGLLVVTATFLSGILALVSVGGPSGGAFTYVGRATFTLASATLPVTLGVAILRHRLYDIDLLIKATLVYGALSAVLVASYVAAVIVLSAPLRAVTGGSEIAVAGSTLATLALVQPLRRRIQDAVDRRFYRSRYDAARALDAFNGRLRDEVDLDALRADVLDAVAETVRPSHATVWIRNAFRTPRA